MTKCLTNTTLRMKEKSNSFGKKKYKKIHYYKMNFLTSKNHQI